MKPIIKIMIFITVIILGIILLSTSSHYNHGNSWLISWTGSILYMVILLISNYIKNYKSKVLYFFNNTISILAMYFLLSKILLDKESAIFMIWMYILSTSRLSNNFFRKGQKRKINNMKTDI